MATPKRTTIATAPGITPRRRRKAIAVAPGIPGTTGTRGGYLGPPSPITAVPGTTGTRKPPAGTYGGGVTSPTGSPQGTTGTRRTSIPTPVARPKPVARAVSRRVSAAPKAMTRSTPPPKKKAAPTKSRSPYRRAS